MSLEGYVGGFWFDEVVVEEGYAKRWACIISINGIIHIGIKHRDHEVSAIATKYLAEILSTESIYRDGYLVNLMDIELENLKKIANVDFEKRKITILSEPIKEIVDKAIEQIKKREEEKKKKEKERQERMKKVSEILGKIEGLVSVKRGSSYHRILYKNTEIIKIAVDDVETAQQVCNNIYNIIIEFLEKQLNEKDLIIRHLQDTIDKLKDKIEMYQEVIKEYIDEQEIRDYLKQKKKEEIEEEINEMLEEYFYFL